MQTEAAAIKRDRDECVKLLQSNAMSPIFYASTQVYYVKSLSKYKEKR